MGITLPGRRNARAIYVERIDITGNTQTRDKVIRREFRVNEGDAFNALKVKRSQDRFQSLGFFQENLEIKQTRGIGARQGRARRQRRGKVDRRTPAVGRLFEPREVHPLSSRSPSGTSGARARSSTPASTGRAIRSRSSSASSSPICSTSRSCSAAIFSAAITTASITSVTTGTRPTRKPALARRCVSASR